MLYDILLQDCKKIQFLIKEIQKRNSASFLFHFLYVSFVNENLLS
jgi:hypothetical protein